MDNSTLLCCNAQTRKTKAAVEARGGYEIGDTILGLTSRMSLNLNTAKAPAGSQTKPFGCTVTGCHTEGDVCDGDGDGLTRSSTSIFLGLANSRTWPLIFAPSNSRDPTAEESRPAAGFGVVVGIDANVEHRNKWIEKGGTRGMVAAPPPTSPNGSVVHCSPQLEDLKQPTREGSQGQGTHFGDGDFLPPVSPASVSIHRRLRSARKDRACRTTHPDPNKQVQQENSANSTTTPKTRSIPPGVARYFPWFGTTVSHDDMDRDRILSRPNQVLGDEEIPDGLT